MKFKIEKTEKNSISLKIADYRDSDAEIEMKNFSAKSFLTSIMFLLDILMEETEPVIIEKHEWQD